MNLRGLAVLVAALALSACATTAHHGAPDHPEARLYDASTDATALVDAAIARGEKRLVNVLLVLGANWCHDSRAFAGWTQNGRIGELVAERYELVFVNVGMPQTGDGHNLHIADRYELGELEGTPTVLIIGPDGTANGHLRNRDTAKSWRNAASRSEGEIFEELNRYPRPYLGIKPE